MAQDRIVMPQRASIIQHDGTTMVVNVSGVECSSTTARAAATFDNGDASRCTFARDA